MYKRIILAVDLAEASAAPKGLAEALELAKAWGGSLRLVNVQPVVPATFMEYVPADFDAEQTKRAMESLDEVVAKIDLPPDRKSGAARAGGIYHELAGGSIGVERRPDRGRLPSPGDERLSARIERQDHRSPRAVLGARGAVTAPARGVARERQSASGRQRLHRRLDAVGRQREHPSLEDIGDDLG